MSENVFYAVILIFNIPYPIAIECILSKAYHLT